MILRSAIISFKCEHDLLTCYHKGLFSHLDEVFSHQTIHGLAEQLGAFLLQTDSDEGISSPDMQIATPGAPFFARVVTEFTEGARKTTDSI